jgi:Xaa-Pro aminopeptidase
VEICSGNAAQAAVQWLAAQPGTGAIAFDPQRTTVHDFELLKQSLPARLRRKLPVPLKEPLMESLRMVKDEDEIAILSEAARIGSELFNEILPVIKPGLREIDLAAEREYRARRKGAEGMSFETIIASGVRSALPHGRATTLKIPRNGFITMDFGVLWKGYCSDMTRTVHMGKPGTKAKTVYQAVLDSQLAAVEAAAAGVSCEAVDEAARSVLRSAGLADYFTHSTGHGVGLEIHEPPRVGAKQKTRLQSGMVITIEPGVYLPGRFVVRIEDMAAGERGSCRSLTGAANARIGW